MGIKTVAVYSKADAGAEHCRLADEAIEIGPAPSAESYLVIEKIIAACQQTGAQAVHPGFGFLSENATFVEALDAAGIVFIGPPTKAIGAMGDKITSKKLANEAGVSTVPGHMGLIDDGDHAVKIAADIGYPVMIKASAGGGGKGMRVAWDADEAKDAFRSAQNEARASFGDDRIFIEKYIEEPRHIEIQVLADQKGNTVYLGERECSIQRRHQKVIEEAPSPFLDEATRAAMGAQSVALAQAVDYCSAGTVEFIVDKNKNFYFLEMNTRIQVEHPVTELITGLDLVAWMIRIAAGEALDFSQQEVTLRGWAVEARVYAEDPLRNFLPSIGRLVRYEEPYHEGEDTQLRIDSGVVEGSEISMYYDPMIAKVVSHGPDRATAIDVLCEALDSFYIRGINHNVAFLTSVLTEPRFREGRLTTNFIPEVYPDGFQGAILSDQVGRALLGLAVILQSDRHHHDQEISGRLDGGMAWLDETESESWVAVCDHQHHAFELVDEGASFRLCQDGEEDLEIALLSPFGDPVITCQVGETTLTVQVDRLSPNWRLTHAGAVLDILVLRSRVAELAALMPVKAPPDLSRFLLSPMPGLLVSVAVSEGQEVKAGEELAVIEAMKMENILRAERDGKVAALKAEPGASLAVDQVIIEFE